MAKEKKDWKRILENPTAFTDVDKDEVLKNFMLEFFDFKELCKVGFFKKEWKHDYKAQADRVCQFFGYKSVFEYGLTAKHQPVGDGFWNEMKSIYE